MSGTTPEATDGQGETARILFHLDGVEERLRIAQEALRAGDAPVRVRAVVQHAEDDVRRARAALAPDP